MHGGLPLQIRGMKIDEAIRQMEFSQKKASKNVLRVLKITKQNAKVHHQVEDNSDMFVREAYVGKGQNLRGIRWWMCIKPPIFCWKFIETSAEVNGYAANKRLVNLAWTCVDVYIFHVRIDLMEDLICCPTIHQFQVIWGNVASYRFSVVYTWMRAFA